MNMSIKRIQIPRPPNPGKIFCSCGCGKLFSPTWNGVKRSWATCLTGHNKHSLASRRKMSASHLGLVPWNKGKKTGPHTAEHRRKNSASHLGINKGKKLSLELRIAMSERQSRYLQKAKRVQQKQTYQEHLLHLALDKRSWMYVGCKFLIDGSINPNYNNRPIGFTADFVNWSKKILVWTDGCGWHGCPKHSNRFFAYRQRADALMVKRASKSGWICFRFWEHDILNRIATVISKLKRAL